MSNLSDRWIYVRTRSGRNNQYHLITHGGWVGGGEQLCGSSAYSLLFSVSCCCSAAATLTLYSASSLIFQQRGTTDWSDLVRRHAELRGTFLRTIWPTRYESMSDYSISTMKDKLSWQPAKTGSSNSASKSTR